MTAITLTSGTSRNLDVTLNDNSTPAVPIDLTLCTNIVWIVLTGDTIVLKKNLAAGIVVTDAAAGGIIIVIDPVDTAPEHDPLNTLYLLPLGSVSQVKQYTHELRLYFSDGTQEVPETFMGYFTVNPTDTWGVV